MTKIKSFKQLTVWQKSMGLVKSVYILTKRFPKEELYALTSQIRRSAVSVPSNISEGFRKWHPKEFKQALNISLGSLAELETQIIISREVGYISHADEIELLEPIDHLNRMIVSLNNRIGRH